MAGVAALADVDVTARELEWRIDAHVGGVFDGLMDGEERRDLDEAADAGDADDSEREPDRLALQPIVKPEHPDSLRGRKNGRACGQGIGRIHDRLTRRVRRGPDRHPDVVACYY